MRRGRKYPTKHTHTHTHTLSLSLAPSLPHTHTLLHISEKMWRERKYPMRHTANTHSLSFSLTRTHLASSDTFAKRCGGKENAPRRMLANLSLTSRWWKGGMPDNIMYNTTPHDHMSTCVRTQMTRCKTLNMSLTSRCWKGGMPDDIMYYTTPDDHMSTSVRTKMKWCKTLNISFTSRWWTGRYAR